MKKYCKISNNSQFYYQSNKWGLLDLDDYDGVGFYNTIFDNYCNSYRFSDIQNNVISSFWIHLKHQFISDKIYLNDILTENYEVFLL